jgi:hypothetical protein
LPPRIWEEGEARREGEGRDLRNVTKPARGEMAIFLLSVCSSEGSVFSVFGGEAVEGHVKGALILFVEELRIFIRWVLESEKHWFFSC